MNNRHTISDPASGRHDILDGEETRYGETQDDRQDPRESELRNWIGHADEQIKRMQAAVLEIKRNRQRWIDQLK